MNSSPMFWLEMSRDETHGGGDWGFTKCVWSPAYKHNETKTRWTFYETILEIKSGDSILHLRGKGKKAAFVGFSRAQTDGFKTTERPPSPGEWAYADTFHKAILAEFVEFQQPILLQNIFDQQYANLQEYFEANKRLTSGIKQRLFYVRQAGRLQCLNGAYLTEVDAPLAQILLGIGKLGVPMIKSRVETGEALAILGVRIGQNDFSNHVRANYDSHCCFPECKVTDSKFLIASHIARWADAENLRGELDNGLCFCLMHDKAFEEGYFTINESLEISINQLRLATIKEDPWHQEHLVPYEGQKIKPSKIKPAISNLRRHWNRIGFSPEKQ